MDSQQRLLKRLKLLEDMDIIIRESVYHRTHDEVEDTPGIRVWHWEDEEGRSEATF